MAKFLVLFALVISTSFALPQNNGNGNGKGKGKGPGNGNGGGGGGGNDDDYDEDPAANYDCPENNGFFPDLLQCDLYYECIDGNPVAKLCPDGLLFEDGNPNQEKCDYPFNVDCGTREYVQEPETGIDERCYRANGFFNHESPEVCNKFHNCVNGVAYELPCAYPLIFDEAKGTCVGEDQASEYAKKCKKSDKKKDIAGFTCPDGKTLGPNGQPLAHPSFPHPLSCRNYISCYFGTDIKELGCLDGQVFDHRNQKCSAPEDGPDDCQCWYECLPDSPCSDNCRSDCSCPGNDDDES